MKYFLRLFRYINTGLRLNNYCLGLWPKKFRTKLTTNFYRNHPIRTTALYESYNGWRISRRFLSLRLVKILSNRSCLSMYEGVTTGQSIVSLLAFADDIALLGMDEDS